MKTIFAIFIFILSLSMSSAMASDTIKANNSFIEYTGRIDFSDPTAPKFSYSGVSIRASFQGTSVSILLNDEGSSNEYDVIVDNVIKRITVSQGLVLYPIASGLTDTVHEIEIFRLTELTFGKTTFNGFLIDKGKSLVAISNQRTHLIEYIGNSITCGYGNEGVLGGTFGPTTENHYLTYAAFNSRNFNARHLAVCRSGIGIYRNYGDAATGSTDCMTNDYSRIFLYDSTPIYDFPLKPDLICIDLGTNDFSSSNGDSARYVNKYFSFIDTLQLRNKNADILLLLGPMLSDPDLSSIRKYLKFIVDSANKKNNGKLYFFEMSQQTGNYGIDYHPVVSQHLKNGLELTAYIKQIEGWAITPIVLSASTLKVNEIIVNFNTEVIDTVKNFNGFSVLAGEKTMGIKNVYIDSTVDTELHIILTDSILVNQTVSLSYSPGNISSKDTLKLRKIAGFVVTNSLTETKVSSASVNKKGTIIFVYINKKIVNLQSIEGIVIFDYKNNILQIDSFKVTSSSYIQFYMKNIVAKGDTIYIKIPAIISGQDGVIITPTDSFPVQNLSSVASSVEEKKLNNEIVIYPNPVSQKIINYKIAEDIQGHVLAEIFDMQGRQIISKKLDNSQGEINLDNANIKPGTYILKFTFSNRSYEKLIVF
jgi:hypothetical protein